MSDTRHVELTAVWTRWTAEALDGVLPGEDCQFSATLIMHPQAPPPGLVLLLWVTVPSLARLGTHVGGAHMVPLDVVAEESVKDATRTAAAQAIGGRRDQLQQLNGGPGGMPFPPLNWNPEG